MERYYWEHEPFELMFADEEDGLLLSEIQTVRMPYVVRDRLREDSVNNPVARVPDLWMAEKITAGLNAAA